jgi:type I restriction enzyme S subunit
MPLPPLAEQLEIEASVLKAAEAADDLIATVEASLTLLQERRSALISAAVTGQIDVRGFSSGGGSEAA